MTTRIRSVSLAPISRCPQTLKKKNLLAPAHRLFYCKQYSPGERNFNILVHWEKKKSCEKIIPAAYGVLAAVSISTHGFTFDGGGWVIIWLSPRLGTADAEIKVLCAEKPESLHGFRITGISFSLSLHSL